MSLVSSEFAHDLRQPLNVIALVTANLRGRLTPVLAEPDATYLGAKLDRIENQLVKTLKLIDAMAANAQSSPDR